MANIFIIIISAITLTPFVSAMVIQTTEVSKFKKEINHDNNVDQSSQYYNKSNMKDVDNEAVEIVYEVEPDIEKELNDGTKRSDILNKRSEMMDTAAASAIFPIRLRRHYHHRPRYYNPYRFIPYYAFYRPRFWFF